MHHSHLKLFLKGPSQPHLERLETQRIFFYHFWLIRSFGDAAYTGSSFVCCPLHHCVSTVEKFEALCLFRSDLLLMFSMIWPWFFCGADLSVSTESPNRDNYIMMIFWIFPVVLCHGFCIWHWPNCKKLGFSLMWGHHDHHLHLVNDLLTTWLPYYLLHRADENQQGRSSCTRLQF